MYVTDIKNSLKKVIDRLVCSVILTTFFLTFLEFLFTWFFFFLRFFNFSLRVMDNKLVRLRDKVKRNELTDNKQLTKSV